MKRIIICFVVLAMTSLGIKAQKLVYIPDSLKAYNLDNPNERWCWKHSVQTDNLVFFWEKGFGDNPLCPPDLDGHPMKVDMENLENRVEGFYQFFRDSLRFSLPGSKADKYKMMVMINYSLDGTAYGGTYDNFIGALWVAPNRIQDKKLNCLAHELGHSFQLQISADSISDIWGGNGFFEMTSQWMLWQVNPNWVTDENYHFQAFRKLTHKAFLSIDNIYHSPYVLEYWAEKHGLDFIAKLYRNGKIEEDPALTYMRMCMINQKQFNNEMFDCYTHLLNFDFRHAYNETRPYACTFSTPMDSVGMNTYRIPADMAPEEYGFNAIKLAKPLKKNNIKIKVKRLSKDNGCDLKYSLVEEPECYYLLVMNAPRKHVMLQHPDEYDNNLNAKPAVIEYQISVKGTNILK